MSSIRDVKGAGNCYFGDGKYKAAVRKYRKCLRYLEHAFFRIEEVKDLDTKEQSKCSIIILLIGYTNELPNLCGSGWGTLLAGRTIDRVAKFWSGGRVPEGLPWVGRLQCGPTT